MDPVQPISNGALPEVQVGPASAALAGAPPPVSPPNAAGGPNADADDSWWLDDRPWDTLSADADEAIAGAGADRAEVPSVLGDAAVSDERAGADAGDAEPPEVLDHVYRPLLQHLEAECRRVLAAADTEAEKVRAKAQDEARRILTEAHRERSAVFRRASSKQALMYEEAESEIQRWLEELDEERQSVLETAHDDAARLLRVAAQQADADARDRLEAADREAQAIVAEARLEAAKYRGPMPGARDGGSVAEAEAPVTTLATGSWLPKPTAVVPALDPVPPPPPAPAIVDLPPIAATAPAAPAPVVPAPVVPAPAAPAPVVPVPVADAPVAPPPGVGEVALEEQPSDIAWMTAAPETVASGASNDAIDPSGDVADGTASGASAMAVENAVAESLSRRERRGRRRFGLGKSGR